VIQAGRTSTDSPSVMDAPQEIQAAAHLSLHGREAHASEDSPKTFGRPVDVIMPALVRGAVGG
jgi:hypothetical protein